MAAISVRGLIRMTEEAASQDDEVLRVQKYRNYDVFSNAVLRVQREPVCEVATAKNFLVCVPSLSSAACLVDPIYIRLSKKEALAYTAVARECHLKV